MLSGLLLLLATAVDLYAYLTHEAVVDEGSYREAQEAAFSCARLALSRLDADSLRFTDMGTTTVQLNDTSTCEIVSGNVISDSAHILAEGDTLRSSVRIFVTADRAFSTAPFQLRTWTEY